MLGKGYICSVCVHFGVRDRTICVAASPRLLRPALASSARLLFDGMAQWDALVDAALARLASRNLLRATRPIALAPPPAPAETFAGPGPWDRAAVEIQLDRATLHQWLAEGT